MLCGSEKWFAKDRCELECGGNPVAGPNAGGGADGEQSGVVKATLPAAHLLSIIRWKWFFRDLMNRWFGGKVQEIVGSQR